MFRIVNLVLAFIALVALTGCDVPEQSQGPVEETSTCIVVKIVPYTNNLNKTVCFNLGKTPEGMKSRYCAWPGHTVNVPVLIPEGVPWVMVPIETEDGEKIDSVLVSRGVDKEDVTLWRRTRGKSESPIVNINSIDFVVPIKSEFYVDAPIKTNEDGVKYIEYDLNGKRFIVRVR